MIGIIFELWVTGSEEPRGHWYTVSFRETFTLFWLAKRMKINVEYKITTVRLGVHFHPITNSYAFTSSHGEW